MNMSKKINVNFSSLVGLKAELLKKQTEVIAAKGKSENIYTVPKLKKKERHKHEKTDEILIDEEDINAHKKSKLMLEAKARLYKRLKKSRNNNDNFLVDFKNKSDESEEELHPTEADYDDKTSDPEDAWVEYEDCFGRTRKCLRKDLTTMKEKDNFVKQQVMKGKYENFIDEEVNKEGITDQEKEPDIEIMRRKWEEQTRKLADKANIHYQDVLFDEARAHGVAYYAFSQDEEERAKQQENLNKLRKETEQKQKEMKELKQLRDKMEQNRLRAAKIRQRIRAGLPAEPMEEIIENPTDKPNFEVTSISNEEVDFVVKNDEGKVNVKENKDITENFISTEDKIKALGELIGKRSHWREMSQEEWVHKRRKERDTEFAPIYDNFRSGGFLNKTQYNNFEHSSDNSNHEFKLNEIKCSTKESNESSYNTENSKLKHTNSVEFIPLPETSSSYNQTYSDKVHNIQANINLNTPTILPHLLSNSSECIMKLNKESSDCYNSSNTTKFASSVNDDVNTSNLSTPIINRNINEEKIAAGLKYLREKFEENKSY